MFIFKKNLPRVHPGVHTSDPNVSAAALMTGILVSKAEPKFVRRDWPPGTVSTKYGSRNLVVPATDLHFRIVLPQETIYAIYVIWNTGRKCGLPYLELLVLYPNISQQKVLCYRQCTQLGFFPNPQKDPDPKILDAKTPLSGLLWIKNLKS